MISRRSFIVGIGSGLILPKFFERAVAMYEHHEEALLVVPGDCKETIIASRRYTDNFQLLLGDPTAEPPSMTLLEYIERYSFETPEEAQENYGLDLDDEVPDYMVIDAWCRQDSPNALAYRLLDTFDLGPLRHRARPVGGIDFIDGACPGNDYLGVEAATELDLSLLQARLSDLNSGIRVVIDAN